MEQQSLPVQSDLFDAPQPPPAPPLTFLDQIQKADSLLEGVTLDIDSLGPWSYSKYKALKKCPFQFYLKYVLKFKVPENLQLESDPISTNVGKAAHEILESVILGKSVDNSFAKVKRVYLSKGYLTEESWTDRVEPLHFNISNFSERISSFGTRNPVKRVLTELRMAVNRNFEPTGFFSKDVWLRGVIDLVLVLECLDIVIFDHKTGGGQGSIKNYEEQLDWYKILFHYGISPVQGAQTGVHFIGEGVVKMANYSPVSEIETNLKHSLEMSLDGAIELLKERGYFKHVRGPYCKWCEYDNIGCKSGEFKDIELGTKKWIPIQIDKR